MFGLRRGSRSQGPPRGSGVKLLFDENLSPELVKALQADYPSSAHLAQLQLGKADDEEVWAYARENEFVIVSKDVDFYEFSLTHGSPPKLIWIQLGNCTTERILEALRRNVAAIKCFSQDPRADAFFIS